MAKESKFNNLPLTGLSGLMLILSYLFSQNPSSGSIPIILLFSGIILAILLAIKAFSNK